jgi:signal transduction histidine kinase
VRGSIRARLTAWYSLVVIAVVVTSVVAVDVVQNRLGVERLDGELHRLMLTLEGVMRTEFGEGLTLEEAAEEASAEVVAPDRTLVLTRDDGSPLAMWGRDFPSDWKPSLTGLVVGTVTVASEHVRVVSRAVSQSNHRYVAAVIAPLSELEAGRSELRLALLIGSLIAMLVAVVGGWVVGHQTLKPLAQMAEQATVITDRNLSERLAAPHRDDELGRFAASFNGLLDRLATVIDGQRQFMADASHELRTPVSVVRTTAQVSMARENRSEAEYRESMAIVAEQAARLARLVEAMLMLSRAEARGLPLNPVPLYIDELVGECVRGLRVIADGRRIDIVSEGKTDLTFSGDDTLLRQMVSNLLENAIRHASARVLVTTVSTRSAVSIIVADDGKGIPPADRERIFQRFVRLNSNSAGSGLGLPIARWIAEAHGGSVTLEPATSGAIFRVILPIT